MATRQTALFACLFSMAFSANAHNYQCKVEGTYSVVTGTFRFTKKDLMRERETHSSRPCPLAGLDRQDSRGNSELAITERRVQNQVLRPDAPSAGQSTVLPDFNPNMCGVVDGYHEASALIVRYCTRQAQGANTIVTGTQNKISAQPTSDAKHRREIGFKVVRPASYNTRDHHQRYSFNDGPVTGTCYVCVKMKEPSADPVKRVQVKPED
ncbi:MAG: hypothetical protein HOP03_10325 [Lysobacter sp.]|nr:hypothetical protein [Lysobacter sp.]